MAKTPKYERLFHELTDKEQDLIEQIKKPSDIKTMEVVKEWIDDHLSCVGTKINGVEIGFWWIGDHAYSSAFHYPDSIKAKAKVCEMIQENVKMWKGWNEEEA